MKKRPDSLTYIAILLVCIVVAAITTAIISSVKNNQAAPADIRARAGIVDIVKLTGTLTNIDTAKGILTVNNVTLAPDSRTGPATNYGTWTVTPPQSFNLSAAVTGKTITFTINADSFDVASHNVVASQVTVSK